MLNIQKKLSKSITKAGFSSPFSAKIAEWNRYLWLCLPTKLVRCCSLLFLWLLRRLYCCKSSITKISSPISHEWNMETIACLPAISRGFENRTCMREKLLVSLWPFVNHFTTEGSNWLLFPLFEIRNFSLDLWVRKNSIVQEFLTFFNRMEVTNTHLYYIIARKRCFKRAWMLDEYTRPIFFNRFEAHAFI